MTNQHRSTILIFLVPLVVSLLLSSCNSGTDQVKHHKSVLERAVIINDHQTAISTLHQLISLEPSSKLWRDSLAVVYFGANMMEQAFMASKISLSSAQKNPSERLLRVAAESSKVLGLQDESLKYHLRLLEYNPNSTVLLYDIGLLYFGLFQLEVGMEYMERVIANPLSKEQKVTLFLENNQSQQVSYFAAANNVIGYGCIELKRYEDAKAAFEVALNEYPEFANANANLRYLMQLMGATDQ